jgi:hypothetical protein
MQSVLQYIKYEALTATRADFHQHVAPFKHEYALMQNELRLLKQDNQSLRAAHLGVYHACQGLDPECRQYLTHVLDLSMKYTSTGAGSVGDLFTDALESPPAAAAQLINLREDIADIRDRLPSKSITINYYIPPSLLKNLAWCSHHLPSEFDQALVCLDAPTLLHSIGREF